MGHPLFRQPKRRRNHDADAFSEGDDEYGYRGPRAGPDDDDRPALHIPASVILGGLVIWSVVALGVWWLVDPVLSWISGAAGPLADTSAGFAKWFGLEAEAKALRDAADIEGLVGWAAGPVHFFVKAVVLLAWIAGLIALVAMPAVLRRRRATWH